MPPSCSLCGPLHLCGPLRPSEPGYLNGIATRGHSTPWAAVGVRLRERHSAPGARGCPRGWYHNVALSF